MLAGRRHHMRARRGIVLVLVLAMLGLLALIGVTFATFSGQARINARLFAQSVIRPQDDELMDFALQQLVTDTTDVRSVIHGHSLARDMFGNDAFNNGFLAFNPAGGPMQITKIQSVPNSPPGMTLYDVQTNIPTPAISPLMYGYDFTRWIMRVSWIGSVSSGSPQPVSQTCEILIDDYLPGQSNTAFSGNAAGTHAFRIGTYDTAQAPNTQTVMDNPTLGYLSYNTKYDPTNNKPFPGWPTSAANANPVQLAFTSAANAFFANNTTALTLVAFTLDGRWLYAFNGPGLGTQTRQVTIGNLTLNVPLSTYANFRYNGLRPNVTGMDEDYDACDLENWFLAIQSADGQVMIPSFHRPGVVRHDPTSPTTASDWNATFRTAYWYDSAPRMLRPVAADGHDPATFPDLTPDPVTGKINYDVDNDGDGVTDSVWLDLGYPTRRDANGVLYKPLFAFMVIGLNGRIPLNTAGNLAGGNASHANHLGNSASEIDPRYALQNAFIPPIPVASPNGDYDPFNAMGIGAWPPNGTINGVGFTTYNTQVDNSTDNINNGFAAGGLDVRLTQLRNLLAGTRPQTNPLTTPNTTANGDDDIVLGSWPGTGTGASYYLPNGIVDGADANPQNYNDGNGNPLVGRSTPGVPGRWGEASSIPGVPFNNPSGGPPTYLNLVQQNYANPVRAGYSYDVADFLTNAVYGTTPFPRDAADDNYNAFDVYPPQNATLTRVGEVYDLDYYDPAGALMLPVERMRRFVTPIDINGTGSVQTWLGGNNGPDNYGRVQFNSYFRPAGVAGPINISQDTQTTYPYGAIAPPAAGGYGTWDQANGTVTPWTTANPTTYQPDMINNPFHGYESYKLPNQVQVAGGTITNPNPPNPTRLGGMPIDQNADPNFANYPNKVPTYDSKVNSSGRLDGVNEADEMNLYARNPLLDSPYGPSDLEWLYRQQDVDGVSLTSRLAQLAPISFTNTIDGMRRRRLVALDTWESNSFVWANDNPGGAFANNAWFTASQGPTMPLWSAKFAGQLGAGFANNPNVVPSPSLAHRNRKINLNYPLPVSNDPNEPVRQKWISDTYQLLKAVLPPDSVDTAEELAQLSQFVINIIDFRDPDATMTHWTNPDVVLTPSVTPTTYPTLTKIYGGGNLDQFGMESNPVAINEVLAYGFQSRTTTDTSTARYTNRFFIELVNTLTAAYNPTFDSTNNNPAVSTMALNNYYGYGPTPGQQTNPTSPNDPSGGNITGNPQFPNPGPPYQASTLDLGGFTWINPVNNAGKADPYGAGCWDLVFTADNPMSRPDPYRGELVTSTTANYYSVIPLNRDAVTSTSGGAGGNNIHAQNGGDVTLLPLAPNAKNPAGGDEVTTPTTANPPLPATTPATPPITYFYVVGSPTSGNEVNSISTTSGAPVAPCVTQYFASGYDPMSGSGSPSTLQWRQGVLPGIVPDATGVMNPPGNYQGKLPYYATAPAAGASGPAQYLWVCLRRPANPFAPVSLTNPMCVVDCMRFPYIDGTANPGGTWQQQNGKVYPSGMANTIFSAQRLQPYRGGHAVPMANATSTINTQGASVSSQPPDPRYGYSEQICVPTTYARSSTYGAANTGTNTAPASTNMIYHSLGYYNDGAENWDYFPFNDRDFSSVAELLLVPGCPPGLFTKQFVEFAPSQMNAADIFAQVQPIMSPTSTIGSALPGNSTQQGQPLPASTYPAVPFATATVPFLSVSQATVGTAIGSNPTTQGTTLPTTVPAFPAVGPTGLNPAQPTGTPTSPVQPHTFPYLVDKFFYTGAASFLYPPLVGPNGQTQQYTLTLGGPGTTDPSASNNPVVGGPAADGWFKMFEFFEVPSQMTGAIGPVALGTNFDWARQDTRAGLMNLNLIVDEEAFYAVFGDQGGNYGESILNSVELPLLANYNANTGTYSLPYNMPLSQNQYLNTPWQTNTVGHPPVPPGGPPVPLVVSAIQLTGAPNYAYPVTDQTQLSQHGYLAGTDPIQQAINVANGATQPAPGNRIKAAFAQFLWTRHGGSGYMFGYGNGGTGQNSAVAAPSLSLPYIGATPAERPFRALSFPDIDFTIMRPAALPPSAPINNGPASNPAMVANNNIALLTPVTNAQALIYTPQNPPPNWYWVNSTLGVGTVEPNYYAPYVATTPFPANHFASGVPIVYSADPGVRNPFFSQGYVSSAVVDTTKPNNQLRIGATTAYPVYPNQASNSIPAGVPLPVNVAFPNGATPTMDTIAMPPPIPPARLFQPPDAYGAGQMQSKSYTGIYNDGSGNISPAVSNATDSGDPWINNLVAFQALNAAIGSASFTLSNGFTSLPWSGGAYYASGGTPMLTPTGALPPVSITYPPYRSGNLSSTNPLTLDNSIPYSALSSKAPYLGSGSSDDRQHPYWRTEMLQKAMNLTTVRTHQYAVWITVGFFEVKRQGDIDMIAQSLQALSAGNPGVAASLIRDAYDIMGPEVGALNGQNVRFRGFFLVDRLKLTGFNPNDVGAFHNAVVYRKVIQ